MVGAKEIFSIKINEEYMTDREYGIFQNIKKRWSGWWTRSVCDYSWEKWFWKIYYCSSLAWRNSKCRIFG